GRRLEVCHPLRRERFEVLITSGIVDLSERVAEPGKVASLSSHDCEEQVWCALLPALERLCLPGRLPKQGEKGHRELIVDQHNTRAVRHAIRSRSAPIGIVEHRVEREDLAGDGTQTWRAVPVRRYGNESFQVRTPEGDRHCPLKVLGCLRLRY